jgi:hypothetical protein
LIEKEREKKRRDGVIRKRREKISISLILTMKNIDFAINESYSIKEISLRCSLIFILHELGKYLRFKLILSFLTIF